MRSDGAAAVPDRATLTLSAATLQAIEAGLVNLPWHIAHPAITEINAQLAALQPAKITPGVVPGG